MNYIRWAWPQLQDKNGNIWFSNWAGAYRYDRKYWQLIHVQPIVSTYSKPECNGFLAVGFVLFLPEAFSTESPCKECAKCSGRVCTLVFWVMAHAFLATDVVR